MIASRIILPIQLTHHASHLALIELPERVADQYRLYHAHGWCGYVSRELNSADFESCLSDPVGLFNDDHVNRWIKKKRNLLAEVLWPGTNTAVILKKYQPRGAMNTLRLMQGLPRAIRHWNNSWLLDSRGIQTPRPLFIAVPEKGRGQGLVATTRIMNFVHIRDVFGRNSDAVDAVTVHGAEFEAREFARICGRYVREIHDRGVVHRDLSGANILVPECWSGRADNLAAAFCLVDVNRVRSVGAEGMTVQLRFQDLERLMVPESCVDEYFAGYAGDDQKIELEKPRFLSYRHAYRRMRNARNPVYRGLLKTFTYWPRTG